jgi:hypothetical protein
MDNCESRLAVSLQEQLDSATFWRQLPPDRNSNMSTLKSRINWSAVLLALAFLAICSSSSAEVEPGDLITPANAAKVEELLSTGVHYKVVNGTSMKIAATERIEWPPQ